MNKKMGQIPDWHPRFYFFVKHEIAALLLEGSGITPRQYLA